MSGERRISKTHVFGVLLYLKIISETSSEKKIKMGTFSEIALIIGIFGTILVSICAFGTPEI